MNRQLKYYSRVVFSGAVILWLSGCNSSSDSAPPSFSSGGGSAAIAPDYSSAIFGGDSAHVTNPLFRLVPGLTMIYEGIDDVGELERVETAVSHQTRVVDGVLSRVVLDREFADGELVEETFDWYAQDLEGNVWYMGESSNEIEDGEIISTHGSFETGKDLRGLGTVAQAGYMMKANPKVGDRYLQENYPNEAMDEAEVISLTKEIVLSNGDQYSAVQIREKNPLAPDSSEEYKYYAPQIGQVLSETVDGEDRVSLIDIRDQSLPGLSLENFSEPTRVDNPWFPLTPGIERHFLLESEDGVERMEWSVLSSPRVVMGIETLVVREIVRLDGLLIERTDDWFAQDDEGTVWYFGEETYSYEYDENDNLIAELPDGSWEAGVNGAQSGVQMLAAPRVGDSYWQEYYEGVAEDLAAIVELDSPVTLSDGSAYVTVKTLEWNPLEPEADDEFKYYAPGVGLVKIDESNGEEITELVAQ